MKQAAWKKPFFSLAEEEKVSKQAIQKAMIKLEEYGYMDNDHELTEEGWAVAEAGDGKLCHPENRIVPYIHC